MERKGLPVPGEFYRHFKGNLYQVIGMAKHSETGEDMVVYQALYGEYLWYVRPLSEFISPVDRRKYPEVAQEYRFVRVEPGKEQAQYIEPEKEPEEKKSIPTEMEEITGEGSVREELLWFLDAETAEEKLAVLRKISKKMDEELLTTIELSLDLMPDERESIERRMDLIERTLEKRVKYEGGRLR